MRQKFGNIVFFFLSIALCFVFCACERAQEARKKVKEWMEDESGALRVLTTTAHVGDLVRSVGGPHVVSLVLIQGESDPHSYQLVKGDDEKFSQADLVFCSGLGLEHGPSLSHQLEQSHAIAIGDTIQKRTPGAVIYLGGAMDPHIWMDVSLWADGAFVIADALAEAKPEHAEFFRERARKVYEQLMELDERGRLLFQTIPAEKRYLVTTHDAFHYFTRRYLAEPDERAGNSWQERCKAPEGLAPDSQISTQDILEISQYIMKHTVSMVFAEVGINQRSLQKIQEILSENQYSVQIVDDELYSDSMGRDGTEGGTYQGMIWYNMQTIHKYIAQ